MKKVMISFLTAIGLVLSLSSTSAMAVTYGPWVLYGSSSYMSGGIIYTDCSYQRSVRDGANMYYEYKRITRKGGGCPNQPPA